GGDRRGDEDAERAERAAGGRGERGAGGRRRAGHRGPAPDAARGVALTRAGGGRSRRAAPESAGERWTPSGLAVRPVYTRGDLPRDLDGRAPPPGEPPYTRGIHPGMYRARLWTMRQYAGLNDARQTNERFRFLP